MALDNTSILPPLPVEDEEAKRRRLQQQKPAMPISPLSPEEKLVTGGSGSDWGKQNVIRNSPNLPVERADGSSSTLGSFMRPAAESITPPTPMATPVNLPAVGSKIGLSPEVQAAQQHLQEAQAKATQHHSLVRKIFEGVGTMLAPGLMAAIPGTILNSYWERNQAQGAMNSATENSQREAMTQKDLMPPQPTNAFELAHQQNPTASAADIVAAEEKARDGAKPPPPGEESKTIQTDQGIMQWNPQTKRYDIPAGNKSRETSFNANEVAYAHEHGVKPEQLTSEQLNQANRGRKEATTIVQPPRQMMMVPQGDGSMKAVEVRPGSVVPKGAVTAGGISKAEEQASADEKRRADLGNNMKENMAAYEDIVRRRPELFGPIAGRMTALKMQAGSSDPDIAALKVIKEFAGMAAVGTHAMRNAQHAKVAADALMDLNDEPQAILDPKNGTLARARASVETFMVPAEEQHGSLSPQGQGGGKEIRYKIVNGQLVPE